MEDFIRVRPALAGRVDVGFVAFDSSGSTGEIVTSQPHVERRRLLDELGLAIPVISAFARATLRHSWSSWAA